MISIDQSDIIIEAVKSGVHSMMEILIYTWHTDVAHLWYPESVPCTSCAVFLELALVHRSLVHPVSHFLRLLSMLHKK